jgi:molybdate transport system ATP-binding protein
MSDPQLAVTLAAQLGAFTLDVAFAAPARGVTALFGASGAGKTTIVNAIAGLARAREGRIAIGERVLLDTARGIDVPVHRRGIGYVFQEARLFPHMSVAANLRYGARRARGRPQRVSFDDAVAFLGIGHLLARRPAALSGGERQRVALGRALLAQPELLLLDEPLASLDQPRRAEILPHFEWLRDEALVPIVYVSHAIDEVVRLATRVIVLDGGRVVAQGDVDDVFSRGDLRAYTGRRFEGGTVLTARVTRHDGRLALTELAFGANSMVIPRVDAQVGALMRVRILARDVALARSEPLEISVSNRWRGVVREIVARDGPYVEVSVDVGGAHIWALVTRNSVERLGLAPGADAWCLVKTVSLDARTLGFTALPP